MTAPPSRRPTWRLPLEFLCILLLTLPLSCSSAPRAEGARPVPALADSAAAARAFGELRRRWASATREDRKGLQEYVLSLRNTFAGEQVARQADLYLAWIALERGDFEEARRLAEQASAPHPGNVRMVAQLVEGATLSRSGAPEEALAKLLPLVGQLIDVHARELLHEEAVISAITAHHWQDALWLLDVWLRDVPEDDQQTVLEIVKALLHEIPPPSIEEELARRSSEESQGRSGALEKVLFRRLAAVALERQDSALARRLLERPGALPVLGEDAAALLDLAARYDIPQVNGRQIGLYFPDDRPEFAQRGAEVSLGAMKAIRALHKDAPRLVVRQGPTGGAGQVLSGLDAEGVLVIVGGTDPESAERLAQFSEKEQITALLLVPPTTPPTGRWALHFGPDLLQAGRELLSALAKQGAHTPVFVGVDTLPAGTRGFASPCRELPPHGQLARYPLRAWKAQGADALILLGSQRCAQDVLEELRGAGVGLRVAMGLEATALLQPLPKGAAPTRRVPAGLAVGLGCYPELIAEERTSPESVPGYWQRLAQDAILTASNALDGLPEDRTLEWNKVKQRRESVRSALESAGPAPCTGLRPALRMNPPAWRAVERR